MMSGQPSGNPSVTRPTANGVGPSGMTSSQQRTDPQVGSSTSNGQPGSMSQSNLNSIVRQKTFIFHFIYFTSVKTFGLFFLRILSQNSRDTVSCEVDSFQRESATSQDQLRAFKNFRQIIGALLLLYLRQSQHFSCVSHGCHLTKRLPYHHISTVLPLLSARIILST